MLWGCSKTFTLIKPDYHHSRLEFLRFEKQHSACLACTYTESHSKRDESHDDAACQTPACDCWHF